MEQIDNLKYMILLIQKNKKIFPPMVVIYIYFFSVNLSIYSGLLCVGQVYVQLVVGLCCFYESEWLVMYLKICSASHNL
jgi:hypothetical protein